MRYTLSKCFWIIQGLPLLATAGESVISETADKMPSPAADYLVQFGLGLVVVLMTVVALVWILRRVGKLQTSFGGSLKTLGGLSLGARERLVLVQVGDKQLLLGVAPGRIQTLHVLDTPLEKTLGLQDGQLRDRFSKCLATAMQKDLDQEDAR